MREFYVVKLGYWSRDGRTPLTYTDAKWATGTHDAVMLSTLQLTREIPGVLIDKVISVARSADSGEDTYYREDTTMARQHYHVGVNVPGYLPESDVETYTSRRYAERRAAELARDIVDNSYQTDDPAYYYHKSGSARDGLITLQYPNNTYNLGLVVWVEACTYDGCEDGEDA